MKFNNPTTSIAYPMTRIEREKRTVRLMIEIYCKYKLKQQQMPDEYVRLINYAEKRLDHCRFGENKTTCKACKIHCYAPRERQQIRDLMRWVGPRMFFYAPMATIRHMLGK